MPFSRRLAWIVFQLLALPTVLLHHVQAQICTVTSSHSRATYTVPHTVTVSVTDQSGTRTVTTTSTAAIISTSTVATVTLTNSICAGNITSPTKTVYTSYVTPSTTIAGRIRRASAIQRRQTLSCSSTTTSNYYPPALTVTATTTITVFGATTTVTTVKTTSDQAIVADSSTTTITPSSCATTTQADICAPSVQASSLNGYGLSYLGEGTSSPGTTFITNALSDPGACCQLCVDSTLCSASAFNVQTGECHLEFLVHYVVNGPPWGPPFCGQGLYAVEGENLQPGQRWYVQGVCGTVTVIPPEV
ncbi:MAG: hypothetical protein Q9227_005499 [Pyrenula ochraceoflavens]